MFISDNFENHKYIFVWGVLMYIGLDYFLDPLLRNVLSIHDIPKIRNIICKNKCCEQLSLYFKCEICYVTGDPFATYRHQGMQFSTYDQKNDLVTAYDCAERFHNAWWMNDCFSCSFTGPYSHDASVPFAMGLIWRDNLGYYESLEFAEMRLCR